MKALNAQVEGLRAKLQAIGQPESAKILANSFAEAQKAIEETNKALERHGLLTAEQKREEAAGQVIGATPAESAERTSRITAVERTIAATEAETAWQAKFQAATVSIADRIRNQELLTAAIGKGYEATRQANVEARLAQELGEHFNDTAWMASHQGDVGALRTGFTREFDTEHAEQSAQAVKGLRDQIELEKALAQVQAQGAEAVREAALAVKLTKWNSKTQPKNRSRLRRICLKRSAPTPTLRTSRRSMNASKLLND